MSSPRKGLALTAGEASESDDEKSSLTSNEERPATAAPESATAASEGGAATSESATAAPESAAASAPSGGGIEAGPPADLAAILFESIRGPLASVTDRLLEVQEAQKVAATSLAVQRAELSSSEELAEAKAVLDRLPEYLQKVARLKRNMTAAEALVLKAHKNAAALRAKVEAAETARLNRRQAQANDFAKVTAGAGGK